MQFLSALCTEPVALFMKFPTHGAVKAQINMCKFILARAFAIHNAMFGHKISFWQL